MAWATRLLVLALTLLVAAVADGGLSRAKADPYISISLSCAPNCTHQSQFVISFKDTLPTVRTITGLEALDGLTTPCYDVYINDPSALNLSRRIATLCDAAQRGVNRSAISLSTGAMTLPAGAHKVSVRRLWVPVGFTNPMWEPVTTIDVNVRQITTTSLSSSANPSLSPGVTFTANVQGGSPGAPAPTGTVVYAVNGATYCTLGVNSVCAMTLSPGPHTITATYSGDAANTPSSATLQQWVGQTTTALTIASRANPSTSPTVIVDATLTDGVNGTGRAPTGTLEWRLNGQVATSCPAVGLSCMFTLPPGLHSISFTYSGDAYYKGSTSNTLQQRVYGKPVITGLSPVNGSAGTQVTITGENFTDAFYVNFGAARVSSFTINSATSITANAPAGSGRVDVMVSAPAGVTDDFTPELYAARQFTYAEVLVTNAALPASVVGATYGPVALTATGGAGPHTFKVTGLPPGLSMVNGAITGTPTQAGTYTVTIVATDATPRASYGPFVSQPKTLTLAIAKAAQTISFTKPADQSVVQGTTLPLSATGGGSGNPVTLVSSTPHVCTVSNTTVTLIGRGTCSLTASQAGNGNYFAAPDVTQSFETAITAWTIPPTVSAITPDYGSPSGGETVTISGTFFSEATAVTIGGAPASNMRIVDPVTITAVTPPGTVGSRSVVVTGPGGSSAPNTLYKYQGAPVVASLFPASGTLHGNNDVTITGSNLGNATAVTFGGVPAEILSTNESTIRVRVPAGPAGPSDVRVQAPGGSSQAVTYTYTQPPGQNSTDLHQTATAAQFQQGISIVVNVPPLCDDFSEDGFCNAYLVPGRWVNNSFDVPVVLTAGAARWNPENGDNVIVDLTVQSMAAVPGRSSRFAFQVDGYDHVAGGQIWYNYSILVVAAGAPTVASVSPPSAPASGGATVTIRGTNFTGATAVTIGGVAASNIEVVDDTMIKVTVPAGSGTGKSVIVTTPGGSNAANTLFSYGADLALTSVAPQTGPTVGGTVLTLTGTGFTSVTGVTVGGVAATDVVVVNDTTITATAPAHAAGLVPVAVTNGADTSSKANAFTYDIVTQAISFIAPEPMTYLPGGSKQLFATASSGLPVTLTSTTPGVCTVASSRATFIANGQCSITASQAGSTLYAPATDVVRTIEVGGTAQTITFTKPADQVFAPGGTLTLTATGGASGQPVTFDSTTAPVCTTGGTNGATVTFVAAGTCSITASQAAGGTFAAATPVTQSFPIAQAPQTISFAKPADQVFAPGATVTLTASGGASGEPVTFASTTPSVCTSGGANGADLSVVSAGTCSVTASQAGTESYAAADPVSHSFAIAKATQAITFEQPADQAYVPGATLDLSATGGASGNPVTFASTTPSVCTASGANGATVTLLSAGTCSITASQAGTASYQDADSISRSFAIAKAAQAITFDQPADRVYASGATVTLTATGGASGEPVTFASTTASVCTTGDTHGATVTFVSAGTCSITASQAETTSFTAADPVSRSFAISKATQTITFDQPQNQVYEPGATLALAASGGVSGNPVTFASTTPLVCTTGGTDGATVTFVAPGTCSITASQEGDGSHEAASDVSRTFIIDKGNQVDLVVTASPSSISPNGTATLSTTGGSGTGAVSYEVTSGGALCSVSDNIASGSNAGPGSCVVTATKQGDASYKSATATVTIGIGLASQTISFPAIAAQRFAPGFTMPLNAAATSDLEVTFASNTVDVCTSSGENSAILTFVAAGTCSITASQAGNLNFAAATDVTRSFTIEKILQTISFTKPPDQTYVSGGTLALTATGGDSGQPVTFTSTTTSVCTTGGPNGATVTFETAGECLVTAFQAGSTNYAAASPVTRQFMIGQAGQAITFAKPADQIYAPGATLTLSATGGASGQPVTFASTTSGICTTGGTNGATVTLVSTGICSITASQSGNSNYSPAQPVQRSFSIEQAEQAIVFAQPADQLFAPGSTLELSATGGASGQPVTFTSTTTSVCTTGGENGATVTLVSAGSCSITASQAGNKDYAAAEPVTRSFVIRQAEQAITFAKPADQVYAPGATLSLSATGGASGQPVTFASTTPDICTAGGSNGATIKFVAAGNCAITASQAGNTNYATAEPVTQSFAIGQAGQVITFAKPADQVYAAGATLSLSATGGVSGQPVTFASTTPDVCTAGGTHGATITFVAAGNCAITASQAGDTNYAAAEPVQQSFSIGLAIQNIKFAKIANQKFLKGGTLIASATGGESGQPVTFTSSTKGVCTAGGTNGSTITFVSAGKCSVTASQAGNASYEAAQPVTQSFAIGQAEQKITFEKIEDRPFVPGGRMMLSAAGGASGLPVVFSSATSAVCRTGGTNGATVTYASAGTCSIKASQAGNANYAAAAPVTRSFKIKPPAVTISLKASKSGALLGEPITYEAVVTEDNTQPSFLAAARAVLSRRASSNPVSAGRVTFLTDERVLCANVPVTAGVAACTASFHTQGSHSVRAQYSNGGGALGAVTSSAVVVALTDQTEKTAKLVGRFLSERANAIVTNMASADRQIDRLRSAQEPATLRTPSASHSLHSPSISMPTSSRLGDGFAGSTVTALGLGTQEPFGTGLPALFDADRDGRPDGGMQEERAGSRSFSVGGPAQLSGQLGEGMHIAFSTSLSQMLKYQQERDKAKATADAMMLGADNQALVNVAPTYSPFDLWAEGKYGRLNERNGIDGHFGLLSAGADYIFTPYLLAGLYVQYDTMSQSTASERTSISGTGWMAGPYATLRLSDNLFWQGRAAWGKSFNDIRPFDSYADSFESTRWLLSTSLAGRYEIDSWTVKPEVAFTYFEDKSDSYVDAFGMTMPGVRATLGQLKVGPALSYRYELDHGVLIEPSLAMQLLYNFNTKSYLTGLGNLGDEAIGPDGLRGRTEAGLKVQLPSGMAIDLTGSYDGIGASDFSTVTGRGTIHVPLN